MPDLDQLAGQELFWVPSPTVKRSYDLRAGEAILGTVAWQRGTLAAADLGAHQWTFKREGFWRPRVTIRVEGSETDLALFRPSWSGSGTLDLSPTQQITWQAANMRHSRWTWRDAVGQPLVHVASKHGWTKHEGTVEIEPAAALRPELPLLVALGWYLVVLLAQDSTTAAVVATTT